MDKIMKMLTRILIIAGFLVVNQACNELLESPDPSVSTTPETILDDESSLDAMRASMLNRLHGFTFKTRSMLGPDALADNLTNASGTSRFSELAQNQLRAGMNDGVTYAQVYNLIEDANILIGGVDIPNPQDPGKLSRIQGEAYALRAYAMHYLVRVLGYDPGAIPSTGQGAGFDLGIIIRTEPILSTDDVDERARSTVSEVYAQILSDLQEAETRLAGVAGRTAPNEAFVHALRARVQLYNRNWSASAQAAAEALNSTSATLADSEEQVEEMFNENSGGLVESLFTVVTNPSTERLGVNNSLNAYTASQWNAQMPTQDLLDLYDPDDFRLTWFAPCFDDVNGDDCVNDARAANDNGLEIQKWNGEKGLFTDDTQLIRVAELKLIRAEALARDANAVTPDALAAFNDLRRARGVPEFVRVSSFDAFIDLILDERRRELVAEGHRFFDLKRLGRDIRKPDGSSIPFSDLRVLDDIDPSELEANSKLVQNPGY